MRFKLVKKMSLVLMLCLCVVSCNKDSDDLTKTENTLTAEINFKQVNGETNAEVISIGSSNIENPIYTWTILEAEYPSDREEGKGLYWAPSLGETEFCLTVTSTSSDDSMTVCKTLKYEEALTAEIEFKQVNIGTNAEVIAIGSSNIENPVYTWTILEAEYPSDREDGKGLYWAPSLGETEFCLKVRSTTSDDSINVCKTLTF